MKPMQFLMLCLLLGGTTATQAQFWKNLSKKAQEAAERTVERKVEEKSEREAEKSFDSVFNNQGKLFKGKKAAPAAMYTFTHIYSMDIVDGKRTTAVRYYLNIEQPYFGTSTVTEDGGQMVTVLDIPEQTAHTFMDMGDSKTIMSFGLDLEGEVDETMDQASMEITITGNTKEILGYQCEEYQVTGPDHEGTLWVTQEASVSFSDAFVNLKSDKSQSNSGLNQAWMSMVDGLVLEMTMTDTTRKKPTTIQMICTDLQESEFSIDPSQYSKAF